MICWLEHNHIAHGQSPQNCGLIWQGATRLLQEFQDAAMCGNVFSCYLAASTIWGCQG